MDWEAAWTPWPGAAPARWSEEDAMLVPVLMSQEERSPRREKPKKTKKIKKPSKKSTTEQIQARPGYEKRQEGKQKQCSPSQYWSPSHGSCRSIADCRANGGTMYNGRCSGYNNTYNDHTFKAYNKDAKPTNDQLREQGWRLLQLQAAQSKKDAARRQPYTQTTWGPLLPGTKIGMGMGNRAVPRLPDAVPDAERTVAT